MTQSYMEETGLRKLREAIAVAREQADYASFQLNQLINQEAVAVAHDHLSKRLEDENAGNDEIRDAAISLCSQLNVYWAENFADIV
jgi:hypothetical protein